MKKLFALFIATFAYFNMVAESAVIDYTYAHGELGAYGKGKKEVVDVAMCLNDSTLAGMRLHGFKAYITTTDGIGNTSMWLSRQLTLDENKANAPDVASYDVTAVETVYDDITGLAVLSIDLPEPLILTEEPLYLGYSMTINDISTEKQKNPIVISEGANPNGLFLHMSKSILKWMEYSSNINAVALIVASLENDFPEYSLGFDSCSPFLAARDEDFQATFMVTNFGVNNVENVRYTYSIDGGDTLEGYEELTDPIKPGYTSKSPLALTFAGVAELGQHGLEVTITEVNGSANDSRSATISCSFEVLPFVPVHRPLVEEYTGLWCGWCPKGYIGMEMIAEKFGDSQVSICYHNQDAMTVTSTYPIDVTGFPNASVDRIALIDPYYGSHEGVQFGISLNVEAQMAVLPECGIDLRASLVDDKVEVSSSVKFIQDFEDASYEIGYVLVCNGLSENTWGQSNYFSGSSGYQGTPLEVLANWPSKVYGLVFNDVAVDVSAMKGISNSIPSDIEMAKEYTNDFTFDIAGNSLIKDTNKLVVTAFVINKKTGRVVNANKFALGTDNNGIGLIDNDADIVATEFFDLTGRRVLNPSQGIFIKTEKLSDGSIRTAQIKN